ncbi:MAG TPA: alpha/beta hydrolase [Acidimicrobiales bacterium]|nr:alpha/beta hydrolase [Acidimicrobiales bacterium]
MPTVPLDPQVKEMLDAMAVMGAPPLSSLTPQQAREQMKLMAGARRYPEPRASSDDHRVPGPGGDIPVRVYRPAPPPGGGQPEPLPLVMWFHGGGWVIGDIDTHDATCQQLAVQVPAVVVSVDYRLAPEHRFPAAVDDCEAATRWAAATAAALGADPVRIAVAGDSAGGNLAALVAHRLRDARREGDTTAPQLSFQLLVYPATDLTCEAPSHAENGEGYLLTSEAIAWFLGHYIPDRAARRLAGASPLRADDLTHLPPALVITAEYDPLRDEGEAYARALTAAGVPATASRYDGMIHAFFGMDAQLPAAVAAVDEAATALRGALHPA